MSSTGALMVFATMIVAQLQATLRLLLLMTMSLLQIYGVLPDKCLKCGSKQVSAQ